MTKHPEPEDPFAEKAGWFDQHYNTTRGRVRFRVLREQLREVLPAPPADILDAGGGTGRFAAALAADGYRVTLLDPSRPSSNAPKPPCLRTPKTPESSLVARKKPASCLVLDPSTPFCCTRSSATSKIPSRY